MAEEKQIPTTEILAEALEAAHAPAKMIEQARAGHYDDFKSDLLFPIRELVKDARAAGLASLSIRATSGEFEAQLWECDAWRAGPEGKAAFRKVGR